MHVRFPPSCSTSVTITVAWIKGSVAFPRGFPTRLSHRAVPRATMVGVDPQLESRGSAEKQVPLEWTETSRGLLEWWHDDGVPLAFPVDSASSEVLGNAGNSFPTKQRKDPSSRSTRRKRGSSGWGRDSRASSRVETRMSGNFLSCSKGVKDLLEVPEFRCD